MRKSVSGRESFRYKASILAQRKAAEDVRKAERPYYKDTIDSYDDADPQHPIAAQMLRQDVTLDQALEAVSQHFDRRLKAMRSARMQEGIGPAFSALATGAGFAAGAVMAVAETTGAFACGGYSWWVCNREVNVLQNDVAEFERVRDHIELVRNKKGWGEERKRKAIVQALNHLDFHMEGVKLKLEVQCGGEPDPLEADQGLEPLRRGRQIKTELKLNDIVNAHEAVSLAVEKTAFQEVRDGFIDATKDSVMSLERPDKWVRDVSSAGVNIKALSKFAWQKNRPFGHVQYWALDKVSGVFEKAAELPHKLNYRMGQALQGRFALPELDKKIEVKKEALDQDTRLAERLRAEWQGFGFSMSAASADISLAVLEAGQAYAAMKDSRTEDGADQALMVAKSAFHGAAVFYSTDAPRALARRGSDHANNICSPLARTAVEHVEMQDAKVKPPELT